MRRFSFAFILLLTLVSACGGDKSSTTKESAGNGTASPVQAGSAATATAQAVVQPKGELRVGVDFLPALLDAPRAANLIKYGVGETLTRITPELKVEPWLAERVTSVDSTTWRVVLRPNAKFHDGSAVDANAVAASFKRAWEVAPAANGFIAKETVVSVIDARTLDFKTPQPNVGFANNLTAAQFVLHKPSGDTFAMTGPYKVVKLVADESLELAAFTDHWSGPPPLAKVSLRLVKDPNTRVLALQAGDIDMLTGLPVEMVASLPADFEKPVVTGTRTQYVIFNHARAPFSEKAVREAFSLAVDRNVLNKVGQDGQGKPLTGIFPTVPGVEVVAAQSTDLNRARQVLDAAGWAAGADGMRAKDGKRLTFSLYSYPQRADLTPMAVSIQAQLKAIGMDARIEQTQDITKTLLGGDFDAAMYSFNVYATADPLYGLSLELGKSGDQNFGKFSNPQIDALITRMRDELDPAKRTALSREIQEAAKVEAPNAYLIATPLIYAYKKSKVRGFVPHPVDLYFLDNKVSVQ